MQCMYYSTSGNFHCKKLLVVDDSYDNEIECALVSVNVVWGRSYKNFQHENLSYKSFTT